MISPLDDYIAGWRRQPGPAQASGAGEVGAAAKTWERPEGKAYVGAPDGAPEWDRDTPLVQEAQRTAGTMITPGRAYGFFTDTTLCIGCKACEVACKQWNHLPADGFHFTGISYDHTRSFSATTWRHVRFIEQFDEDRFGRADTETAVEAAAPATADEVAAAAVPAPGAGPAEAAERQKPLAAYDLWGEDPGAGAGPDPSDGAVSDSGTRAATGSGSASGGVSPGGHFEAGAQELRVNLPAEFEPWGNLTTSEEWARPGARWLLMSDVCKHCVTAPCLEACPTGSIIRTEFDSVLVQQDVCNGCGYCVPACPFGVVEVDKKGSGKAHKCTLCYDRLKDGLEPACAKVCPTDSIQFGPVDELLERARVRVAELRARGIPAYLYGSGWVLEEDCDTSALGGLNCFFLLIDRPEVYNLPPVVERPSTATGTGLLAGAVAAAALTAGVLAAFGLGRGRAVSG